MTRGLRLLDLFCGAGGAGAGYSEAGFEVVGVDVAPQPRYPFEFHEGDAFEYLAAHAREFDAVHASPPCQHSTAYKRRPGHVRPCANRIAEVRDAIAAARLPGVIENVEGARPHMVGPIVLCGSMFGLDVRRHRLFEPISFSLPQPECRHGDQAPRFPPATNRSNPRRTVEVGVWRIPIEVQRRAMGIPWMELRELSQAVPPAYTRWVGRWLADHLAV